MSGNIIPHRYGSKVTGKGNSERARDNGLKLWDILLRLTADQVGQCVELGLSDIHNPGLVSVDSFKQVLFSASVSWRWIGAHEIVPRSPQLLDHA